MIIPCPFQWEFSRRKSGFDNLIGADAGRADSHTLDFTIDQNADILNVRAEGAFGVFDNMETNAAFLLGQTTVGDVTADYLMLSAYFTYSAHVNTSIVSICD